MDCITIKYKINGEEKKLIFQNVNLHDVNNIGFISNESILDYINTNSSQNREWVELLTQFNNDLARIDDGVIIQPKEWSPSFIADKSVSNISSQEITNYYNFKDGIKYKDDIKFLINNLPLQFTTLLYTNDKKSSIVIGNNKVLYRISSLEKSEDVYKNLQFIYLYHQLYKSNSDLFKLLERNENDLWIKKPSLPLMNRIKKLLIDGYTNSSDINLEKFGKLINDYFSKIKNNSQMIAKTAKTFWYKETDIIDINTIGKGEIEIGDNKIELKELIELKNNISLSYSKQITSLNSEVESWISKIITELPFLDTATNQLKDLFYTEIVKNKKKWIIDLYKGRQDSKSLWTEITDKLNISAVDNTNLDLTFSPINKNQILFEPNLLYNNVSYKAIEFRVKNNTVDKDKNDFKINSAITLTFNEKENTDIIDKKINLGKDYDNHFSSLRNNTTSNFVVKLSDAKDIDKIKTFIDKWYKMGVTPSKYLIKEFIIPLSLIGKTDETIQPFINFLLQYNIKPVIYITPGSENKLIDLTETEKVLEKREKEEEKKKKKTLEEGKEYKETKRREWQPSDWYVNLKAQLFDNDYFVYLKKPLTSNEIYKPSLIYKVDVGDKIQVIHNNNLELYEIENIKIYEPDNEEQSKEFQKITNLPINKAVNPKTFVIKKISEGNNEYSNLNSNKFIKLNGFKQTSNVDMLFDSIIDQFNLNTVERVNLNTEAIDNVVVNLMKNNRSSAIVYEGRIYIAENNTNKVSAYHELTHMLLGIIKHKDISRYKALLKLVENTDLLKSINKKYPDLAYNDRLEETLAEAIGIMFTNLSNVGYSVKLNNGLKDINWNNVWVALTNDKSNQLYSDKGIEGIRLAFQNITSLDSSFRFDNDVKESMTLSDKISNWIENKIKNNEIKEICK